MKAGILTKQSILIFIVSMCLIPVLTFARSKKIPRSNFEIVSYRGEWKRGTLYIIGEIKNKGNVPAGVQVEVIARDSQGMLIASKKFWPNSVNGIYPGNSCGIDHPITKDARAKTLEIKVISVTDWD